MHQADLHHPRQSLEEKLQHLYRLNRDKTVDLGFRKPFINLLEAFGNPHLKLPPTIHIAGTNGKGSVLATIRSILEADGKRVHAYTSPHLQRFNERIYLTGQEIDDQALEDLVDEALRLNAGGTVTFFEIATALSMAAFSRTQADVLLLETGLGGRLDCTNVVEKPLVSVITTISYDHTEFLGNTIEQIASEKAGIIKQGIPVVLGPQAIEQEKITNTVARKAHESCSSLFTAGKEWSCEALDQKMIYNFPGKELVVPLPNLEGSYQIGNAGTALMALQVSGLLPTNTEKISTALRNIHWPGRLQLLDKGPLSSIIPQGWDVYVDGGHNDSAGIALAEQTRKWKSSDNRPVHVILGMLRKKDPSLFLEALLQNVDTAWAVSIPCAKDESWTPAELERIMANIKTPVRSLEGQNVEEWLTRFFNAHKDPGRLLICGSIYLAGDVLQGYLS